MKAYIGMDYRRGLMMLKEYIETGKVDSFVHIEGVLPLPEGRYTGISRSCAIEDLDVVMRRDFDALYDFMLENGLSTDRIPFPFAVYEAFDIPRGTTEYIAAIPLEEDLILPKRWVTGKLPGGRGLKTMHKGAYEHLGNAWTTAMQFARYQKIATAKRPVGYELASAYRGGASWYCGFYGDRPCDLYSIQSSGIRRLLDCPTQWRESQKCLFWQWVYQR